MKPKQRIWEGDKLKYSLILICILWAVMVHITLDHINKDIKESRIREDLLYKEVKNLDYLVDVLTQTYLENRKK